MSKAKKRKKSRKPLIIGIVMAMVLITMAILFLYLYGRSVAIDDLYSRVLTENKDQLQTISDSISSTLNRRQGYARVFDSYHNVLFTLRNSSSFGSIQAAPAELSEQIQRKILDGNTLAELTEEEWLEMRKSFSYKEEDVQERLRSSLACAVLDRYASLNGLMLSTTSRAIFSIELAKAFSSDELVRYCMITGTYGDIEGIVNASNQWFSADVEELTSNQQEYLVYAYQNPDASWGNFVKILPDQSVSQESYGFSTTGVGQDRYLRTLVLEELKDFLGVDEITEEYNVEIGLNPELQKFLQDEVDKTLSTSVSLGPDGQAILDSSIVMVDSKTAVIKAYVVGRSVNSRSKELTFPCESVVGDYKAIRQMFEGDSDLSFNSIVDYKDEYGVTRFVRFSDILEEGVLSAVGAIPEHESIVSAREIIDFGLSMYGDSSAHLITQISKSKSGEVVYVAPFPTDRTYDRVSANLRSFLAGGSDKQYVSTLVPCIGGLYYLQACDQYIVAGLAGSGVQGYQMSSGDEEILSGVYTGLLGTVKDFIKKEPDIVDSGHVLDELVQSTAKKNEETLKTFVNERREELVGMPIKDVATRNQFERRLDDCLVELSKLAGSVSDEMFADQYSRLAQVRIDRTEDILSAIA